MSDETLTTRARSVYAECMSRAMEPFLPRTKGDTDNWGEAGPATLLGEQFVCGDLHVHNVITLQHPSDAGGFSPTQDILVHCKRVYFHEGGEIRSDSDLQVFAEFAEGKVILRSTRGLPGAPVLPRPNRPRGSKGADGGKGADGRDASALHPSKRGSTGGGGATGGSGQSGEDGMAGNNGFPGSKIVVCVTEFSNTSTLIVDTRGGAGACGGNGANGGSGGDGGNGGQGGEGGKAWHYHDAAEGGNGGPGANGGSGGDGVTSAYGIDTAEDTPYKGMLYRASEDKDVEEIVNDSILVAKPDLDDSARPVETRSRLLKDMDAERFAVERLYYDRAREMDFLPIAKELDIRLSAQEARP